MGLDTVELVLAIEEEFGITIQEEDAEHMVTPRLVADYVFPRVRVHEDEPCPSQSTFYRIRSVLVNEFGVSRREIRRDSQLYKLLEPDIKAQWARLRVSLGAERFPTLERSNNLIATWLFGAPAVAAAILISLGLPIMAVTIVFLVLLVLAHGATSGMGTIIPENYRTVASLIPYVGCASTRIWTYAEVLARIVQITSDQLGIPVEKIHADSRFVQDLGAD